MTYDDMHDDAKQCKGKIIRNVEMVDNAIRIEFDDCILSLEDTMQSCCECRWMNCDDPLHYWKDVAFVGYRVEGGGDISDDSYGCHEVQFLIVDTFLGSFTVANHNSHNGYYGGFHVSATVWPKPSLEGES